MTRTYGLNPDHCPCCQRALRVARAVDRPRLDLASLASYHRPRPDEAHCACCQRAAAHLDHASRIHAQLVAQYRQELDVSATRHRLLTGALRLFPPGTRLPDDLQAEWAAHERAQTILVDDLAQATRERDSLVTNLCSLRAQLDTMLEHERAHARYGDADDKPATLASSDPVELLARLSKLLTQVLDARDTRRHRVSAGATPTTRHPS